MISTETDPVNRPLFSRLSIPLLGNAGLVLIGFATTRLLTASYAPEQFGVVAYVNGLTFFFLIFSDLGLGATHTRKIAAGENLAECIQVYFRIKLVLVALCGMVIVPLLVWHVPAVAPFLPFRTIITIVALMTAAWALTIMGHAISYTLAGLQQIHRQLGLEAIRSATFFACLIWAWAGKLDARFLAASYVIAAAAPLLMGIYWLRHEWSGRFRRDLFQSYRELVAPTFGYMLMQGIPRNLDGFLVAQVAGVYQVGIYYAAKRIVAPLDQCSSYMGHVLLPAISELSQRREGLETSRYMVRAERVLAVGLAPVIAGAIFFSGPVVLFLLGPAYKESVATFSMLLLAASVALVGSPYYYYPTAAGRPIITTRIMSLVTPVWLVTGLLLGGAWIPGISADLGALGCALATLAMAIIQTVLERRMVRREIPGTQGSGTWQLLLAALGCGAMAYVVFRFLGSSAHSLFAFGVSGILMMSAYTALLAWGPLLRPEERAEIGALLARFKLARPPQPSP